MIENIVSKRINNFEKISLLCITAAAVADPMKLFFFPNEEFLFFLLLS
jgi:hypothetical protein